MNERKNLPERYFLVKTAMTASQLWDLFYVGLPEGILAWVQGDEGWTYLELEPMKYHAIVLVAGDVRPFQEAMQELGWCEIVRDVTPPSYGVAYPMPEWLQNLIKYGEYE